MDDRQWSPEHTTRVGAAVSIAVLLLAAAGLALRLQRAREPVFAPPVDPGALARPERHESKLLGWRSWSYPTRSSPAEVRRFATQALVREGWEAVARDDPALTRYIRGEWVLDLRCETIDGETRVAMLLTRLPRRAHQ